MSRSRFLNNTAFRFILAVVTFVLVMHMLRTGWKSKEKVPVDVAPVSGGGGGKDRLVVAHFMLGNTYPYTEADWKTTLHLAEETGLDGLALNLGPDSWQTEQAKVAFQILESLPHKSRLRLFFSLDCTVLPTASADDGRALQDKISHMLKSPSYLRYRGEPLVSTFGGESAGFGGQGWGEWLGSLNRGLGEEVFFMPAFFLPPEKFSNIDYVDGMYAWNSAWPLTNRPNNLNEDEYFLDHKKPYMASISPLFFTHYGTEGEWAFNKNFIYRSDDLLYPNRWSGLLSLPVSHSPDILQIISWNDYGESHNIGPVLGAQPGSEAWTDKMSHEAFREMTYYFIGRWRDRQPEVSGAIRVWMWYRTHPATMIAPEDRVGRPEHADWAQDLINVMVVVPETKARIRFHLTTGHKSQSHSLSNGKANTFTIPFAPGPVNFEITADRGRTRDSLVKGDGREIVDHSDKYNFNMWTGSWRARLLDQ